MKVLVIGSGGREHALVWKLKQSPKVSALYCAPGNPGIGELAELVPLKADDINGLLLFVKKTKVDLTVVGPETPLVHGIVDVFEKDGQRIFGPSKSAAELEGSKVYAKQFMKKYRIPTASFEIFSRDQSHEAQRYVMAHEAPLVLKADGLAGGKGAVVCKSKGEALGALRDFFEENIFGDAGAKIVVEEFMRGEEASLFVLSDGMHFKLLQPAQDHKQILDGDQGKNTGGMGAYAPARLVTQKIVKEVETKIVVPVLNGMNKEGRPYKGCLYIGLMMTADGPKVVEFNCRFGDPETQVVLPLIDADLFDILSACTTGSLNSVGLHHHDAMAVCIVMTSRGYPDQYQTGKVIGGLDAIQAERGVIVFHAGTKKESDKLVSAGGRVFGVTAIGYGHDLEGTINAAYSAVKKISFDGAYYRSDIGMKGLKHTAE